MRRPPTFLRFPVDPLRPRIERVGGVVAAVYVVAARYGIAPETVEKQWCRALRDGFTIAQADRWALALGTHPALCWGGAFYARVPSDRTADGTWAA